MNKAKFPGWRTMTAAQRHNARQDAIIEQARALGDWPRADGSYAPKAPVVEVEK